MPINVTMPRLSDTMEQGTVVKWHVKEGQKVSSGDVIADIETDKATMEQSIFDDGVIAKLVCPEGKLVKVGELIAVLAVEGESPADALAGAGGVPAPKAAAPVAKAAPAAASTFSPSSASTAITSPTFTWRPSGHTRRAIVPSSKTACSIVALSVSMSAMTWPELTRSPGLTCHLTTVPCSMVSERRGMVTLMGMAFLGRSRAGNGRVQRL